MFREWWQSFVIQNHKISSSVWQWAQQSRGAVSCFSGVWVAQTQGCPLLQRPTALQLLFQLQPSEPSSHPCSVSDRPTPFFFFYLASCYQSTMSSQIAQNYSTQEEATLSHLVNLYLQSPAPASLWASISTTRATFPKNWPRRRTRHWESLENSKPVLQQNLPGHAEATSRWVK